MGQFCYRLTLLSKRKRRTKSEMKRAVTRVFKFFHICFCSFFFFPFFSPLKFLLSQFDFSILFYTVNDSALCKYTKRAFDIYNIYIYIYIYISTIVLWQKKKDSSREQEEKKKKKR